MPVWTAVKMSNHALRNYAILPPVLLNLWAVALYIPYYVLTYTRPDLEAGITSGHITPARHCIRAPLK